MHRAYDVPDAQFIRLNVRINHLQWVNFLVDCIMSARCDIRYALMAFSATLFAFLAFLIARCLFFSFALVLLLLTRICRCLPLIHFAGFFSLLLPLCLCLCFCCRLLLLCF